MKKLKCLSKKPTNTYASVCCSFDVGGCFDDTAGACERVRACVRVCVCERERGREEVNYMLPHVYTAFITLRSHTCV